MKKGLKIVERSEALKHFEEEYINRYVREMKKNIEKYIDDHRKELTEAFVENFRTLCKKIKEMQKEGRKGKIAYITYSFNIHNLQKESRDYVVQAYGNEWFLEEGEECKISYNVGWLYDFLDDFYGKLFEISKKYMGNINASDMDQVWKKGVIHCDVKLLNFTKRAIKEAVKTEEFKALDKEEVLEIRLGQEKGYNEIIYKMDTRVKDSKKMKEWLESGEKNYSYSVLQNLDLSGGNYKGITCNNTDFSGSNLSNSNFEDASLIESVFVKSIINGVNFKKSRLSKTDFSDTVLENSDLQEAGLRLAILARAQFINCNLNNAKLYSSDLSYCTFKNSFLTNTKFYETNLENADLSGNNFMGAVFFRTKLIGADLSNADLTGTEFINIDFTTFKFDNAKFANNKVKEIKVYEKDLYRLNLSEEQLEEVTVVK
jgi:uncharacterized protein YjbI with pentapeptide repeats